MKIKSEIIRVYKTLHTWTGIVSALALFIAFYAGAISIFKEPLMHWATPPVVEAATETSIDDAAKLLSHIIKTDQHAADSVRLYIHPDEHFTEQVTWKVRDEQGGSHNKHYAIKAGLDGEPVIEQLKPNPLAQFIDVLHRVLGLPVDSDVNRWIMGVIVGVYSLALMSGLIILLPILVKELFAFRIGRKPKRVWLDAHNVVGVFSLPLHVVMALTAFVFAYHDTIYDVQDKVVHQGQLRHAFMADMPKPAADQPTNPDLMVLPSELLKTAQAVSPSFTPYRLDYSDVTTPRATVRIWGHDDSAIAPRAPGGFIPMNPYTGEVQSTLYLPGHQGAASTTLSSFFALHFATYGGNLVRWAYFILGLAGAWLFFTGNLLWVENRRKRQKRDGKQPKQRKDVRVLATLTVGISLGCVAGISLMIASSKLLSLYVSELYSWHQTVYYTVFFMALAWAWLRGPARAMFELLFVAALFTLAIPLSSVAGWLMPATGLWFHLQPALLAVDITAVVMAFAFAYIASQVRKRVYYGAERDSVWAYSKQLQSVKLDVATDAVAS